MENEKILILFTEDGYYLPAEKYTIRYGEIVCLVLNEYFDGNDMPPHFRNNKLGYVLSQQASQLISALTDIRAVSRKVNIRKNIDPFIKTLPLIVSDRDNYSVGGTVATFKYGMEVETYLDGGKINERVYVEQFEDLLPRDIKKVLDDDIPIYQCYCHRYYVPNRRGQKYCHEHGAEGTNKVKYQNRKRDECKRLYYKIYNRLHAYGALEQLCKFEDEYALLSYQRKGGGIDENKMIAELQKMDEGDKYRVRKRSSRA